MLSKIVRLIEMLKVVRFTSKIVRVDRSATTIIIYLKKKYILSIKTKHALVVTQKIKTLLCFHRRSFFNKIKEEEYELRTEVNPDVRA